jgi:hypothetical protein
MAFSARWDEIAGDVEGIQIDITAGKYDPERELLTADERFLVDTGSSWAEDIVRQLAEDKEGESRWRVVIEGNLSEPGNPGGFSVNVSEIMEEDDGIEAEPQKP